MERLPLHQDCLQVPSSISHGKVQANIVSVHCPEEGCIGKFVMVFLTLLCSCPFVEKFSLEIETYYTPDGGQLENVFNLKVLIYSQDDDGDDEFDHDGAQLENVLR